MRQRELVLLRDSVHRPVAPRARGGGDGERQRRGMKNIPENIVLVGSGKYNNVNPSRASGRRYGGYNWRNVNEPGLHGSVRIFSSLHPYARAQIIP